MSSLTAHCKLGFLGLNDQQKESEFPKQTKSKSDLSTNLNLVNRLWKSMA